MVDLTRFLKKTGSRWNTHQRFLQARLDGVSSNPRFQSASWIRVLHSLREKGHAKLPMQLDLPSGLDRAALSQNFKIHDSQGLLFIRLSDPLPPPDENGKASVRVALSSKILSLVLSEDLHTLIHCYYGNPSFWIRNDPVLMFDSVESRTEQHGSKFFHIDWATHQLSIMIMLSDCTMQSTRTTCLSGTNKRMWPEYDIPYLIVRDSPFFLRRVRSLQKKYRPEDLVCSKGEVIIFDAGNCLHKGVFGADDRLAVHMNFAVSANYAGGLSPRSNSSLEKFFCMNRKLKEEILMSLDSHWHKTLPF